ncbi:FGGY family carbohydrate kinase [Acidiferrobacter sp.]|uniref:FGGY family carbohydrate kinase n=1 Tax=Acidiferrobacter sp. TaxID=1872107 RepID=UPI0026387B48|nr:FGGY family carbohydrate kinase [Acidiferrobacter sp.]
MLEPLYLALDQGGQSTRAVLFDPSGTAVARARVAVGQACPDALNTEQDAEELVGSLQTAIARVTQTVGAEGGMRIAAAGLATQRSSTVCWDTRTGAALSPVLSWQDRRAAALMPAYGDHAPLITQRTGLRLSPHYGAPKMRWCLDNLPAVKAAFKAGHLAMGPLGSFLVFRSVVPRALVVDPANAARTLLWAHERQDWDPELLDVFQIPWETLPSCAPTCHPFGAIPAGGAFVPLTILTGDQAAALYCEGTPRTDTIYINIGTGAFLQRPLERQPVDQGRLLWSAAARGGGEDRDVLEGTVNGAGAALAWGSEALAYPDLARDCDRLLTDGDPRPLFLNAVGGLGSPYWRPDASSRFEGDGTRAAKAAALIESIVFLIQENIEALCAIAGPCAALVVTGGLAMSDGLCQMLANVSGIVVRRPAESEATARGLAFLAAGHPRDWPAGTGRVFQPMGDEPLRERRARWRALMPASVDG